MKSILPINPIDVIDICKSDCNGLKMFPTKRANTAQKSTRE